MTKGQQRIADPYVYWIAGALSALVTTMGVWEEWLRKDRLAYTLAIALSGAILALSLMLLKSRRQIRLILYVISLVVVGILVIFATLENHKIDLGPIGVGGVLTTFWYWLETKESQPT